MAAFGCRNNVPSSSLPSMVAKAIAVPATAVRDWCAGDRDAVRLQCHVQVREADRDGRGHDDAAAQRRVPQHGSQQMIEQEAQAVQREDPQQQVATEPDRAHPRHRRRERIRVAPAQCQRGEHGQCDQRGQTATQQRSTAIDRERAQSRCTEGRNRTEQHVDRATAEQGEGPSDRQREQQPWRGAAGGGGGHRCVGRGSDGAASNGMQ